MKKILTPLFLAVAFPLMAQTPVGKVVDLIGDTSILRTPSAKPAVAVLKQEVFLSDIIKTAKTGSAKILFNDDTLLTVKENSSVLITEFLFDPAAKKRKAVFNLSYGTLRAVVGKFFGKEQPVEINTPTAVAGIRGTDIGTVAQAKSATFFCFDCTKEAVSVFNVAFPEQVAPLQSGESIQVLRGKAALAQDIVPIPQDILDRKDILFDIQKGAASQAVESNSKETAKETASAPVAAAPEEKEAAPTSTVLQEKDEAQQDQITAQETTPTTADTDTTVNPGAKAEPSTTIKITLP